MSRLKACWFILILLAVSLPLTGCRAAPETPSPTPTAPPRDLTGALTPGQSSTIADQYLDIGENGFAIHGSATALEGLRLTTAGGSLPRPLEVTCAPVEQHSFGAAFNPLTPLITFSRLPEPPAGGLMQLTIPVQVPPGHFAMGLAWDAQSQTLEGLPTLAQDDRSLTLGARSFTQVLISSLPVAALETDIDSGFRPGVDDWPFTCRRTAITLSGQANGQSLSALGYYLTGPDGPDLSLRRGVAAASGLPDTPDFDLDDSRGLHLTAALENALNWPEFGLYLDSWRTLRSDELTRRLTAYSLLLTGRPQIIGLGGDNRPDLALLCYQVRDGRLYLADPRYPGDLERGLDYRDARFQPYHTSSAVDIPVGEYTRFYFAGSQALLDWDIINDHWTRFNQGETPADSFPDYKLVYLDPEGRARELEDGYITDRRLIYIGVQSAGPAGLIIYRDVYREGAALLRDVDGNIELNEGVNRLGIYVARPLEDGSHVYLDFRYLEVVYRP